jgi:hypothetical protein
MRLKLFPLVSVCAVVTGLAEPACAQGGPPFLTNDPGTPGNGNWEINIASIQTVTRYGASYKSPDIDLNYGLGDRIQLTYEVPYVVATAPGEANQRGWGNAFTGVKWRFYDAGEGGWQLSTFPQLESGLGRRLQEQGIGDAGPRYFLPVQASHGLGPVQLDFEVGYYLPVHGVRERTAGMVVGRQVTPDLEIDGELFDDRMYGGDNVHAVTWDIGGRYKLHRSFIVLFMAGRSLNGTAAGQPQFLGYLGLQVLLSHYGLALGGEEGGHP